MIEQSAASVSISSSRFGLWSLLSAASVLVAAVVSWSFSTILRIFWLSAFTANESILLCRGTWRRLPTGRSDDDRRAVPLWLVLSGATGISLFATKQQETDRSALPSIVIRTSFVEFCQCFDDFTLFLHLRACVAAAHGSRDQYHTWLILVFLTEP